MTVIEATYNEKYKKEVKQFMWKRFKGLSDEEFSKCCERVFDTFVPTNKVPLPLIPHFLGVVDYTDNDKAITAIEKVKYTSMKIGQYESINFGDIALHRTIEYFGGWPVVTMWGETDWQYNEKKFQETYKTFLKTSHGDKLYILVGLHEESNRINGYEIAPPKRISLPWSNFEIEYKETKKLDMNFKDIVKGVD
jgi:hypothetical protein